MDILRDILIAALVFGPLERLRPNRPDQGMFRAHWRNDLLWLFVNGFVIRFGFIFVFAAALAGLVAMVPAGIRAFVGGQPFWVQAIGAIIVADIGFYCAHRSFHAMPFLWRFHAVHHSIEELDWLAAHRVHPVDQILTSAASLLPLVALGFSNAAIILYGVIYLLQSHLIHANVRLDFGMLRWLIATPQYHHWHHANEAAAHGHNYGAQLTFMDALFGTLRIPAAMPARYGTDEAMPQHYLRQLLWPFRRRSAEPVETP